MAVYLRVQDVQPLSQRNQPCNHSHQPPPVPPPCPPDPWAQIVQQGSFSAATVLWFLVADVALFALLTW